jgi:amino acid adenylation domain-containing protein
MPHIADRTLLGALACVDGRSARASRRDLYLWLGVPAAELRECHESKDVILGSPLSRWSGWRPVAARLSFRRVPVSAAFEYGVVTVMRSLLSGFLASSEEHPGRPALEVGGEALTYAELRREATALASALGPPHAATPLTAVFAYRSRTAFAGVLASLLRGHGYVPLNRTFPPDRTRLMLERSECGTVIVDDESAKQLPAVLKGVRRRLRIVLDGESKVGPLRKAFPEHDFVTRSELDHEADWDPPNPEADALVYLLFTSGSTGTPKAVGVTNRNVISFLDFIVPLYGLTPDDRVSQTFDMTFDLSVFDMFVAWERGACVCCPTTAELLRPDRFIRDSGLTVWFSVPSAAIVMRRLGMLKPGRFPGLRLSLFCGEPLPVDIATSWAAAAPHSVVENLYGPTELTIACTRYRWTAESQREAHLGLVPIGTPFPGMEPLIVDDDLRPVASEEAGELLMAGPQMTPGYWRDPGRTSAAFVVPPSKDQHYYRTGDRVRRSSDGPLLYLGRVDHQIKVRGHRVELGEVEAIVRDASGLQGVVAVGWPRTESGAAGIEVFVEGNGLETESLRASVSRRLPDYMVPRRIHALDRLPLNSNGKYDRSSLVQLLDTKS